MSDNEAHGTYERPDLRGPADDGADDGTAAAGQSKALKWFGVVVAAAACLAVAVVAVFADDLPTCDGTTSRGMIEELFPQVPVNTVQTTVADLTGISETGRDEEAKTRTCQATLIDSEGTQHAIGWTITKAGDAFDYQLEVRD